MKAEKDTQLQKRCALLFLGVGAIITACAIVVIPFWWLISRFFAWIKYWHVFLFVFLSFFVLECNEWYKDYKNYKKLYSPWLMMFVFTLVYFIIIFGFYFVAQWLTAK